VQLGHDGTPKRLVSMLSQGGPCMVSLLSLTKLRVGRPHKGGNVPACHTKGSPQPHCPNRIACTQN
jgi:hypothetical protein